MEIPRARFPSAHRARSVQRDTSRCVVTHALRRHLTPIPTPFALLIILLSPSPSLVRQNFPLMSNNRTDSHFVHSSALLLLLLLHLHFLPSHILNPFRRSAFSALFLPRTIIAFVPPRSLVVLNFHISPQWKKDNGGDTQRRKGRREEGRNIPISIPRRGPNAAAVSRKKDSRKKRARERVCLSALN